MGLDKIFAKQEKVEEEKKLEAVNTSESKLDELVFKLVGYFEQSIPTKFDIFEKDFEYYKQYLQKNYQITPSLVSKINLALPKQKNIDCYLSYKGVFLSALIQTSYDQSFNGFEFEEINADNFGAYLKGKKGKPIIIKAEKISGQESFNDVKNVVVETQQLKSHYAFFFAKNVTTKIIKLNGDGTFEDAENVVAEIQKYKGYSFGMYMKDCKIYSSNQQVLKTLKEQRRCQQRVKFVLGKMPERLKK